MRRLFFSKETIKNNLKDEINLEKIRKIDVFNYLGTLELGILMVEMGLIEKETFYSQFGYRIENVFDTDNNDIININIRQHIYENKPYFKTLLLGHELIDKKNEK